MTAGLVLAGIEYPGVELQLVTGSRPDLNQVKRGSERPYGAEVTRSRVERGVREAVGAWRHFGFEAAADAIEQLRVKPPARLRGVPGRAHEISTALAEWDRFEHKAALERLEQYRGLLARESGFVAYFETLERINRGGAAGELLRLFDLWRNAQRRAAQSRYDDAVARCYRLVEGAGQWLLSQHARIDTSDVPQQVVPADLKIRPDRHGRRPAALRDAWHIAAAQLGGEVATFYDDQWHRLLDLLETRNHSILAHGWTPIGGERWREWADWIGEALLPLLLGQGRPYGVCELPPQLPSEYPANLLRSG